MQNKQLFNGLVNYALGSIILFLMLFSSSCCEKECDVPECGIHGSEITFNVVSADISGEGGTLISQDSIVMSSINNSSAVVISTLLKVGRCHEVVGYGHAWSSANATPRVGVDEFSDYEDNVNFNDDIATAMSSLSPGTTYWVRSWVAVESKDCERERSIFYNNNISEFTTTF